MNLEERDRPDLALLVGLVATHGFGDGLTTGYALVLHESLLFEQNELVRRLLFAVLLATPSDVPNLWLVAASVFFFGKLTIAVVVCAVAWRLRGHVPRWRVWVALLAVGGLYVTVTNALLL